jgi:Ca2+-binding RTX toxin-like protein
MSSRSFLLRAAALAASALAVPASASAITVTNEGGELVYRAGAGETLSTLVSSTERTDYGERTSTRYLVFGEAGSGTIQIDAATGCIRSDDFYGHGVACPFDPAARVRLEGGAGNDSLSLYDASAVPDTMSFTLVGGAGNDTLKDTYNGNGGRTFDAGPGNDKVTAYGGDDVIFGGDGDDILEGGAGNDRISGGAGNDQLSGDGYDAPGADVIDGGPGNDKVAEWYTPGQDLNPKPTISLDGQANDGRPGEGDNVINVERFEQNLPTDFAGTDADETFEIRNGGPESATLSGGGGNDRLVGWDGADTIDGGAGDDVLEGGLGADTIIGGPGKDTIYGEGTRSFCGGLSCKIPFGDDTIEARDGEVDLVDCGAGDADIAYVDAIDRVTGCERVITGGAPGTRGAPVPDPGAPGTNPGAPGTKAGGTRSKIAFSGSKTVKGLRAGKLRVGVSCKAACKVTATVKAAKRTLATGRTTQPAAGTATVKLKARRGAKVKRGTVSVTLRVVEGAGKPRTLRASLRLR